MKIKQQRPVYTTGGDIGFYNDVPKSAEDEFCFDGLTKDDLWARTGGKTVGETISEAELTALRRDERRHYEDLLDKEALGHLNPFDRAALSGLKQQFENENAQ